MDTLKTYVRMCDHPKIQQSRNLQVGDFYFSSIENEVLISYIEYHQGYIVKHPEQWDYLNGRKIIWLPRQDQIQEIILNSTDKFDTSIRQITLLCNFAYFCGARNEDAQGRSNVSIRKESLEVLWLAFYMYLIHKKTWDGDEWRNWDWAVNSGNYEDGLGLYE